MAILVLVNASLNFPGPIESLVLFGGPRVFVEVLSSDLGHLRVLVEEFLCLGPLACPGC
jgi:hypothetical protein